MKSIYRAFFVKNLMTFLLPMLIPIIVLGALSTYLIHQHIKEEINHNHMDLLKQTEENMELMLNELDSLNLQIVASATQFVHLRTMMTKRWLDHNDFVELAALKNFIDSPAIARSYIDSIYIYIENDRHRFLTSTTGGLMELGDFYDRSWYESFVNHPDKEQVWTEARTIEKVFDRYSPKPTHLITMYRKISVAADNDGVIVLNINTDYIKNYLASLSSMKGQQVLIVDKNNDVLFSDDKIDLGRDVIQQIVAQRSSFFPLDLGDKSFIISKLPSDKYGWTFISITPKDALYEVPTRLSMVALQLLGVSIVVGMLLAYYLTQKNYADVKAIITTLHSAENGKALPPLPSRVKNVYSYIIHRILQNFMEHNYVKVQLSERKYKAQAMEFAALQSQLNPHFLFNTLETINWKAISMTGRPNELNHMVENLADILRYSLDDQNKMVILQKELIYTESYIKIQKVRYRDKFDVIWAYDDEVKKYHVMKLILQPLLENCLYHGIKENERCLIKIKIRTTPAFLHISVIDNGNGIKPEKLAEIRERLESNVDQTRHIGLHNTHKRLKLTYGEPYRLAMRSKYGWGTAVHLSIPID
ncbi:UNVERIFIED_CONTAM: two-component system sensor histidine kinase YesM [Brevibacillus sp. OAP136]